MHTQSIDPSTNSLPLPLPFFSSSSLFAASSSFSCSHPPPSLSFLGAGAKPWKFSNVLPPPRRTNCTSSSTFHHRHVRSRDPAVTAADGFSADTSVIESWWPKNVSMTDNVEIEARARWRDRDAVRM